MITPLVLQYAIAAHVRYPLMAAMDTQPKNWRTLFDTIGRDMIVKVEPWQPLHTTLIRELNAAQFATAKRCLPPLSEINHPTVKDAVVYTPKDKDYEAIVQRIDAPVFREYHDVLSEAFSLTEHYPFSLHVTLLRVKKGEAERCCALINGPYSDAFSLCEMGDDYLFFDPDGSHATAKAATVLDAGVQEVVR